MDLFTYKNNNINNHFQRSIRIDNELTKEFLNNYIFHETGKKVLNQISSSILNSNQCGFTLTGPYGTGKSSLALFLSALLSDESKIRKQANEISKFSNNSNFAKLFFDKKWFIIKMVGSKIDPLEAFSEAIDQSVQNKWIGKSVPSALKSKTKPRVDQIIQKFKTLTLELEKKNHGLLVMVDEMGKYLDFASSVGSDLNLFQEIAENFSNIKLKKDGMPLFFGILHQPFEEYASSLGRTIQEDWQKVQGRFEDIPFSINAEETIYLISSALKKTTKASPKFKNNCDLVAKIINGNKKNLALAKGLAECYPLDPLVTLLLGPISKQRFGQNERSIFTFLNSGEPNGFLNFANDENTKANSIYTLNILYDYLSLNLEPSILSSNLGHAWAEATEAIRRTEALDDKISIEIAKAITLVDLFGKNLSLNATKEILNISFNLGAKDFDKKLSNLEDKKIVIYRKFKKAYALFSGSDINLDEITEANKAKIVNDNEIILSQLPNLQPVIAKRHFFETGTQRIFQKFCIVLGNVKKSVEDIIRLDVSKISAGSFVYVIKAKEDSKKEFENKFNELAKLKFPKPVILGIANKETEFFEQALEIAALKRVKSTVSAIEGDLVAKKELAARLTTNQTLLVNSIQKNFEEAEWYFNSRKLNPKNLSIIASEISGQIYHLTPEIRNELVNREKMSAISSSGSNNLVQRIFNYSDKENLGMEGNPPEFAIYLSIIKKNNLHIKNSDGGYEFVKPSQKNKVLRSLFDTFYSYVKNKKESVSLKEIYDVFQSPPYGLKTGLVPILISTFFKIKEGSLAIYELNDLGSESLVTDFSQRLAEKFHRLPEDIKLMYVEIEGEKKEILEVFKKFVEQRFLNNKSIDNPTPLNVLKPFVLRVYNLPPFAKKTRLFKDKRVYALRDELLSTQNPFELLYKKIPEICGTNDPEKLLSEFTKIWEDLDQVYDRMINQFKSIIQEIFTNEPQTSGVDFETIKTWARQVGVNDPFSARINEFKNENQWLEQVISYAASKPANEWNDKDYNEAVLKIEEMVRHFITSYRIFNLRQKNKDTTIIDIAIFEGKNPERSSKFYKLNTKENNSVEKITQQILDLIENKNLNESEKNEVVLKVLKQIMKFSSEDKKNKESA